MGLSVFVTGGAGLLGVNWAVAMRDRCRVTLGVHERQVALSRVDTRRTDLESMDSVARVLEETEARVVVHTAGMTNVEDCEAKPERAHHVNIELAENVARACSRVGAQLAHISTDHLFSQAKTPATESDPVSPTNTYGRTKAEAEQRVLDANPEALVVRTNFYGWGPRYRPSFSDTIIGSLRQGSRVSLFADVTYTPVLMSALVDAVHGLLERRAKGIFHVSGDSALSKYDFGVHLARCFGLDQSLIDRGNLAQRPDLVPRPRSMSLSNAKATDVLGYSIGGAGEHIGTLREQEPAASTREIQRLS
jgi:dTDP-4-dehydrorhamnose reductase